MRWSGIWYQDSLRVKVVGVQYIKTGVISEPVLMATLAAPRLNWILSDGVVRVPSGKMIKV
jgi:hypothetical protein